MLRSSGALRLPVLIGAALLAPAGPQPTLAQTTPAVEAEAVQREFEAERERSRALEEKARALSDELKALHLQLIIAARDTQERESLVANLELQIEELRTETERRRAVLMQRHKQLAGTLGALTSLSEDAPRAFFLYPGTPLEAVRGSILLRSAVPVIGRRARILREDLTALEAVRADLNDKLAQLSREDVALTEDRARLETLIARKRGLYEQTAEQAEAANKRLRELTEKAETLKDLMAALENERVARKAEDAARDAQTALAAGKNAPPAAGETGGQARQLAALALAPTVRPDGIRAFPKRGMITPPAVGDLIQRYGQETGFGTTSKGIVVETRAQSTVLAPFDGKAVFAGPFRDLGQVLIIEHDGGYHTVLAGFGRIDVGIGNWVLAGEPIGTMPRTNQSAASIAGHAATGSGTRPRLYMELRRDGQPINPLRWITADSIRVNG